MRIIIRSAEKNLKILLPTNMIFSAPVAWIGARYGLRYARDSAKEIKPDQLQALFAILRKTKRMYGHYELVDVESSDGTQVKIVL